MPKFEQFLLPDVGEGLTDSDIVAWQVQVGDTVEVNDVLVEIETAKSLVELPSPFAGVVTKLLVEEGDTVLVGAPIIEIDVDPEGPEEVVEPPAATEVAASSGEEESSTKGSSSPESVQRPVEEPAEEEPEQRAVLVGYGTPPTSVARRPRNPRVNDNSPYEFADAQSSAGQVLAKPPVRRLAFELGVDLTGVRASGPGGLVTREDVVAAAEAQRPQMLATYPGDDQPWLDGGTVTANGRQTRVPVRSVRRRTAEAMVTSAFTAPHVTVFTTVDVTKSMKLVEKLKADREFADVRVTPLLIAAKALVLAVQRHPQISAAWDDETQEIVYKHYINMGIAAATPRGLIVPNIKDAHRQTLLELANSIAEITREARAGKTQPVAMQDGTITITNVGVFNIQTGTPILTPGESAILALGSITERPWVHKGKVKPRWVTDLALSFDHRLVDGELGCRVLADVAAVMEDPGQALVWS